jgi:hypothetical protein
MRVAVISGVTAGATVIWGFAARTGAGAAGGMTGGWVGATGGGFYSSRRRLGFVIFHIFPIIVF